MYDLDVTRFDRSNIYKLKFKKKRIVLKHAKHKSIAESQKTKMVINQVNKPLYLVN